MGTINLASLTFLVHCSTAMRAAVPTVTLACTCHRRRRPHPRGRHVEDRKSSRHQILGEAPCPSPSRTQDCDCGQPRCDVRCGELRAKLGAISLVQAGCVLEMGSPTWLSDEMPTDCHSIRRLLTDHPCITYLQDASCVVNGIKVYGCVMRSRSRALPRAL